MELMVFGGIALGVLALLAVVLGGWAVGLYNSLVQVRTMVDQAWANIDVLLKQRHDQLTKLIEVVKGAKDFEQGTLEKVIQARSRYAEAGSPSQALAGAQAEGAALRQLFALAESYPDLKANANFLQLQAEIGRLEDAIADRREGYNNAVNVNNTRKAQFPDMLLAGLAGLSHRDYFQADEADKQDVTIKF
jgi:LemA protein